MSNSKIIGAIEIGTSKVAVIIAEIRASNSLNIIGSGIVPSQGVQKGEIYDFKAASDSTHAAIMEAEKSAGTAIESVFLSQTGNHLRSFFNLGTVNIAASNNIVTVSDIDRAIAEAKNKQLPEDRVYLHHIQNEFELDGRRVGYPQGMEGERLSVGYWSVHGDLRKVRDYIHVINGFGLHVDDMIISSLASGCVVVDESEKQNGVLVLDIGSGTTDYVLYRDGYVIQTGVVPVGGDHITNDLSIGLRINREKSERIKVEEGKAEVEAKDKNEQVWLIGDKRIGDRSVSKDAVLKIIEVRVEELFSIILKKLEGLISIQQVPCGVVITGGTSKLRGICTIASQVLGIDSRLAELPSWVLGDLRKPELTTSLGLLHYAVSSPSLTSDPISFGKKVRFLDRFKKILTFS